MEIKISGKYEMRPYYYLLQIIAMFLFLISRVWANDDGKPVDQAHYLNRVVLADMTAPACPDTPRGLTQINGNLYRHTAGAGLAVHSGFVLITQEGALIVDPAMTCTTTWLRDEIKKRFRLLMPNASKR